MSYETPSFLLRQGFGGRAANGEGRYRGKVLIISGCPLFSGLRLLTEQSVDGETI
jgi:hypothetical protein